MKRIGILCLCALLIGSMLSCGSQKGIYNQDESGTVNSNTDQDNRPSGGQDKETNGKEDFSSGKDKVNTEIPSVDLEFTEADKDASYEDGQATKIEFSDTSVEISGGGASLEGCKVIIDAPGTYVLTGDCQNGKITVSLGKKEKAQLVLDGLALTCKDGAALVVSEADKVFLTLAEGSENSLSDGSSYTETVEQTNVDGAIFSRGGLTINGEGKLTVKGNYKHGIVSKDDLVLSGGGSLVVTAGGAGLEGKDCVKLCDMKVNITAEGDGIRSTNTEDASRGYVYIESGELTINSQNDGIQAETLLQIDGGKLNIVTGGGSAKAPVKQDNMMGGGGFRPGGSSSSTTTNEESRKGLKCSSAILINGAEITVDSYDDGIHANGDVSIAGGNTTVASGDDGVHADSILEITDGDLSVTKSYEGLEAAKIYIKGGNISLVSSDDGLNASDGSGRGFGGSSNAYLCISGGYMVVNASGDGLDSNGNFDMMGGIVLVSGPTNSGNGALDYGDGCKGTVSGGILIAVGSSGMAENFTNAENQGSMLVSTGSCQAGTSIAVCDEDGKVLVSFTSPKTFQTAVITAPEIQKGQSYTVYSGATVQNADENGFASGSTLTGGSQVATVEMTSLLYGSGGMGGGGGFRPGRP